MSFVNVCQFACLFSPVGFEGGVWNLIVLVPDFCLYFYFDLFTQVSDSGPHGPRVMFAGPLLKMVALIYFIVSEINIFY